MAEAIADLPLSEPARQALLGEANALRSVLDAIKLYEAGSWDAALGSAVVADEAALPRAYSSALVWAHELSIAGV